MEDTIRAAVETGEIPGAVLLAKDATGNFSYASAFGTRSLKDPSSNPPFEFDTVIRIASCTKLVTSIAAMQCVEQGLIGLDDDVRSLVPEMEGVKILKGFDKEGKAIMKEPKEKITLRRLLTHSSGYTYDFLSPLITKWRKMNGKQIRSGDNFKERFGNPLLSEPGSAWMYSPSIDWAGRVVELLNGDISLETVMEKSIWKPLGIKDMTFFLHRRPDMIAKCGDMTAADRTGKLVYKDDIAFHKDPECAFGGQGLFTSPQEYIKILHSLLANDGKLLRPESVDEFFSPQLEEKARESLAQFLEKPENQITNSLNPAGKKDYGLGGMLLMEDGPDENSRKAGTMSWSGAYNSFWFIDRKSGLCGMFATHTWDITTPRFSVIKDLAVLFERTMYERLKSTR